MLKRLYKRYLLWLRKKCQAAMEGPEKKASLSSLAMSEIRLRKED